MGLGRWVSADPLFLQQPGEGVKSPLEGGGYSYALNSPVVFVDPTGLVGMSPSQDDRVLQGMLSLHEAAAREPSLKTKHYSRNENNHPPAHESHLPEGWRLLPENEAVYHMQGEGGSGNAKYVSPDGHQEAVYDSEGYLVSDPLNEGTYNFADPAEVVKHAMLDIVPYFIWGNSPDDPSTFLDRALVSFDALSASDEPPDRSVQRGEVEAPSEEGGACFPE